MSLVDNKFPNILFLLIDCLRADLCFGENRRVKTPTVDALIQRGTSFSHAIATSSITTPAVATIMTGMYPFTHGIRSLKGYKLNLNCYTLAEVLKNNGYTTSAMLTGPLSQETGLAKGFERYLFRETKHNLYTDFGEELGRYFAGRQREPWFLFVHLYEIHAPRQISKKYSTSEYGRNSYEQSFSSLDAQLGKILKQVNFDTTLVILTGDHGEQAPSFLFDWIMKHDKGRRLFTKLYKIWMRQGKGHIPFFQLGHGYHIYEYLVRVPLIFAGNRIPQEKIISTPVGQVDISPTIIDLVGIKQKISFQGRSLLPLINGEKIDEEALYMEAYPFICPGKKENWLVGIRTPEWKFIFAPNNEKRRPELYNLKDDPTESKNLIDKRQEIADQLKEELLKKFPVNLKEPELASIKMSEEEEKEMQKRLRELGYM